MSFYLYNEDFQYIGLTSNVPDGENYTIVEPDSPEHIIWNGESWEEQPTVELTFEQKQRLKIEDARLYFDEIVNSYISDAAPFEFDSWETQRQEYEKYVADDTAPTPYCDMLAYERGLTKEIIMEKVGYKVAAFASIQGKLHHIEDLIKSCTTEEELDLIVW